MADHRSLVQAFDALRAAIGAIEQALTEESSRIDRMALQLETLVRAASIGVAEVSAGPPNDGANGTHIRPAGFARIGSATSPAEIAQEYIRPSAAPLTGDRVDTILAGYREMLQRPQRQAINRWADDQHALSVEIDDDSEFRLLGREAGGLLILLPVDSNSALVLPGGRMVVDFSTSYATTLSLRPVTKRAFDLLSDGAGVLRLVEPAVAAFTDNAWQLSRPGAIAGLLTS